MVTPKVLIEIEGGFIRSIASTHPLDVYVYDKDVEKVGEESMTPAEIRVISEKRLNEDLKKIRDLKRGGT